MGYTYKGYADYDGNGNVSFYVKEDETGEKVQIITVGGDDDAPEETIARRKAAKNELCDKWGIESFTIL